MAHADSLAASAPSLQKKSITSPEEEVKEIRKPLLDHIRKGTFPSIVTNFEKQRELQARQTRKSDEVATRTAQTQKCSPLFGREQTINEGENFHKQIPAYKKFSAALQCRNHVRVCTKSMNRT